MTIDDPLRPPMHADCAYVDGFALVGGSRFATKAEYLRNHPYGLIVTTAIIRALARMADNDGRLLNFSLPDFYQDYFPHVLDLEPDDPPLVFDTFTSAVLMESLFYLVAAGYLAQRGNGDSCDYRLALPAGSS